MIGQVADGIVGAVKYGHRKKAWLSAIALLVTLLVGLSYLLLGALRWNPLRSVYRVTMELPASGGLLVNQDVTLRGVQIGKVEQLSITPDGVNAEVRLNSSAKLSTTSKARVAGLSAAGEQYIDFDGGNGEAPFLSNGSTFPMGRTEIPVTMAELLGHSDGMLKQVDTEKLQIIKDELGTSKEGPQKLTDIVEGGTFLLSTLDGVLPQTTQLLNTSRITLQLVSDKNEGMKVATANLTEVFGGVNRMTGGFRTLTNEAPKTFAATDTLFSDNSDTMVQLLGDLTTVTELMYLRVPALNALFPSYRGSVMDSLSSIVHDDGFWVTADIYPRYTCDYGTPRMPPSSADFPEPFMYNYCRDTDPAVLIRGAKNAPRPAGDDTYGPPPGADLGKRTDPSPEGRYSIPTPYGGPTLPIEPPS
ncbi:MAG: MCE family protein [Mycobacterium sp.]|nr:MCE family protein [Mycobacterium sp.]